MGLKGLLSFPKLKGSANYKAWARSMKNLLTYEGYWEEMFTIPQVPENTFDRQNKPLSGKELAANDYTEKVKEFNRISVKAHVLIQMSCEEKPAAIIDNSGHGYSDWRHLEAEFNDSGYTLRHSTLQKVTSTTLDSVNASLETYVNTIWTAGQELARMGAEVPEWLVVSCVPNNLSGKYSDFVKNTIIGIGKHQPDFDKVVAALYEVDRFSKREEHTTAMALKSKRYKPKQNASDRKPKEEPPDCKDCPKSKNGYVKRHWPKDCWKKHPERVPERYKGTRADPSFKSKPKDKVLEIAEKDDNSNALTVRFRSRGWGLLFLLLEGLVELEDKDDDDDDEDEEDEAFASSSSSSSSACWIKAYI